ncbi:serine/threonine protein kinase [Blastopirellula marina]|uniref:serine/threonine protein kinase n=1 Tax=Blastopirellula marina TaxID=124 RepID=UPI0009D695AA|nr:serine/threonine-protein kinase [Blastopirellula marina]
MLRASQSCQVWEAINDLDRRRVALKALHDKFCKDKEQIHALKHEYEVAHNFDHPLVIHVYEFNIHREIPYLTMECGISRNMKMALREDGAELAYWTPKILEEAAKGLGYVHEQGWIHRDVKPDNFLLDYEGNLKLIDFSIAEKKRSGLSKWFGSSKVQGTRSYMSPEQIKGEALDGRSDLYGLGCTVFELMSGKLPFTATSADHLLDKHLRGQVPSLQAANPNVTDEFSTLVARMMAKKKEDRPDDMATLLRLFHQTKIYKIPPKKPPSLAERERKTPEEIPPVEEETK